MLTRHGLVLSSERRNHHEATMEREMKRVGNLYNKVIAEENIRKALLTVNASHRWVGNHRYNRKVKWVEDNLESCVKELRTIVENGFVPSKPREFSKYDRNAKKWREIKEPKLYPDQYIHHMVIQVLEPVMMRGMDAFCCGSVKNRGAIYGVNSIKKWMHNDRNGTRWCLEMDIRHFYDSLKPEIVMDRFKRLIKDRKVLDLIWRFMAFGVTIGATFSQWFANTTLQPLDVIIRNHNISHYIRYIDNFTVFASNKRALIAVRKAVEQWLTKHGMKLKGNWQYFKTRKRFPNALGYRYGHSFTLMRKYRLLTIKRQIKTFYANKENVDAHFAMSLLSRLGGLTHCSCMKVRRAIVPNGLQRKLKDVVRAYQKEVLT